MSGGVSAFIGLSVRTMRAGCLFGSLAYGSSACLGKSAPPSCTPNANGEMSQADAGIPHPLPNECSAGGYAQAATRVLRWAQTPAHSAAPFLLMAELGHTAGTHAALTATLPGRTRDPMR